MAPSAELADSQARLQSLLEASGSQPQQLQQHAPLLT